MTNSTNNINNTISDLPDCGEFPQRITLELTNKCNLSCTFCPRRLMDKYLGFMDVKLAKKLINEIADNLPVTLVPFFRGESLLHPEWKDILEYAKKKGLGPLQLTTNATLLNKNAANTIIDLEIDFISFSMDTTDPQIYEQTRCGAKYNKTIKNILGFLELKEKRKTKKPEVQVSAVETPLHKPGIEKFVKYWHPKADRVRIYTEHSRDNKSGSISAALPGFKHRMPCHNIYTDLIIYWDGEVALCNHDWTRDKAKKSLGNVTKNSISKIWQSEHYNNLRCIHKTGNVENISPCNHCDHWKMYYIPEGYLGRTYKKAER